METFHESCEYLLLLVLVQKKGVLVWVVFRRIPRPPGLEFWGSGISTQSLLQFWIPKLSLLMEYLEHYRVYDLFPGCWFHTFFIFTPGKRLNLPTIFSDGLKPPTSFSVFLFPLGTFSAPCQVPIMAFSPLEDPSCLPEHCKELAVVSRFFLVDW